jgi:hypothetical protein
MGERISCLQAPAAQREWHNYHDRYFDDAGLSPTPRFERICEIVSGLDCESLTELAGNQGLFSLLALQRTGVRRAVCTDSEDEVVNILYRRVRSDPALVSGKSMHTAIVNFMLPEFGPRIAPASQRLKSDAVVALAVLHHLVLSQQFTMADALQTIAAYARRFVLVEFMPLGLWNGKTTPPVPAWYNEEEFAKQFASVCVVLHVERLEENRVLYVGSVRGEESEKVARNTVASELPDSLGRSPARSEPLSFEPVGPR